MNDFDSAKLQKFSQSVYKDVDEKIEIILSEAEASRREVIEQSNDEGLTLAYDKIKAEKKKIVNKYVRIVSAAELDTKRKVLQHRQKLADQLFENIKYDISDFMKTAEYSVWLVKSVKSAPEMGKGVISVGTADEDKLEMLLKELDGFTAKTDKTITLGGFTLYFEESGVLIDNTLAAKLSEQRELFNQSSYLKLTD